MTDRYMYKYLRRISQEIRFEMEVVILGIIDWNETQKLLNSNKGLYEPLSGRISYLCSLRFDFLTAVIDLMLA